MEMNNALESKIKSLKVGGLKLVCGREYLTGNEHLKIKYFGLVKSRYNGKKSMVHRFIAGIIGKKEIGIIARIDILHSNLQMNQAGIVINNTETKYPTRYYYPFPKDSINEYFPSLNQWITFEKYREFLMEESK